jgi:hypothetical protein
VPGEIALHHFFCLQQACFVGFDNSHSMTPRVQLV